MDTAWKLRQVAVIVADRDMAVSRLSQTFGLAVCHSADAIEGFAMSNALLPVGEQFVEVVSPVDPKTPGGRLLAKYGDGGYLVILQTDDLDSARRHVEAEGAQVTIELNRPHAREIHLHPKTTAGVGLALDWMQPASSWRWAGDDWRGFIRTHRVRHIQGVTLASRDPHALAHRWSDLLGVGMAERADGFVLFLDNAWIRFVQHAGIPNRLIGISLEGVNGVPAAVSLGDARIEIEN